MTPPGGEPDASVDRTDGGSGDERAGPVVALDTSVLMAPVERDLRLFEELDRLVPDARPVVPASVVEELASLAAGGSGEAATAASVGRDLAARATRVETEAGYADDALVALAAAGRADYVATVDAALRERVHERDVPTICLRGERKLAVTR
jgi:rRNA-processing protein FCF1